ncbi:hypothetical protein OH77DRAFT_80523 [Trametes cingulata]|nr:hypothetical protein OH77DRAFT_80523 [Trametes cingulata]
MFPEFSPPKSRPRRRLPSEHGGLSEGGTVLRKPVARKHSQENRRANARVQPRIQELGPTPIQIHLPRKPLPPDSHHSNACGTADQVSGWGGHAACSASPDPCRRRGRGRRKMVRAERSAGTGAREKSARGGERGTWATHVGDVVRRLARFVLFEQLFCGCPADGK